MSIRPAINIDLSKVFDVSVLKPYLRTTWKSWQYTNVEVNIKGIYRPAFFVGTFSGYETSTLKINKVLIDGKPYYYNKRLRDFFERDFLEMILNDNTK